MKLPFSGSLFSGVLPSLWLLWPLWTVSSNFYQNRRFEQDLDLKNRNKTKPQVTHTIMHPLHKASNFQLSSKICLSVCTLQNFSSENSFVGLGVGIVLCLDFIAVTCRRVSLRNLPITQPNYQLSVQIKPFSNSQCLKKLSPNSIWGEDTGGCPLQKMRFLNQINKCEESGDPTQERINQKNPED